MRLLCKKCPTVLDVIRARICNWFLKGQKTLTVVEVPKVIVIADERPRDKGNHRRSGSFHNVGDLIALVKEQGGVFRERLHRAFTTRELFDVLTIPRLVSDNTESLRSYLGTAVTEMTNEGWFTSTEISDEAKARTGNGQCK